MPPHCGNPSVYTHALTNCKARFRRSSPEQSPESCEQALPFVKCWPSECSSSMQKGRQGTYSELKEALFSALPYHGIDVRLVAADIEKECKAEVLSATGRKARHHHIQPYIQDIPSTFALSIFFLNDSSETLTMDLVAGVRKEGSRWVMLPQICPPTPANLPPQRRPRRIQMGRCQRLPTPRELPRTQSHGPYVLSPSPPPSFLPYNQAPANTLPLVQRSDAGKKTKTYPGTPKMTPPPPPSPPPKPAAKRFEK